ncbi:MAG: hypothetical protein Q8Q09_09195 [Deltaproteobacteria bacterium]|nr:hypothetical protein [Deltaproteobacteria bacterium]
MRTPALLVVATLAACAPSPNAVPTDAGGDAGEQPSARRACVRPLAIERAEDLGAFSVPSREVVSRDGVSSGAFGGRILWTFGDTFLRRVNTIDGSHVLSATAGWSTRDAPLALREPVDGNGLPSQLIPYTPDEISANRADPIHNGYALWPGAVLDTGGPRALVLFQRIHRRGSSYGADLLGTARVGLDETTATRDPRPLFVPESVTVGDGTTQRLLFGSEGVSVVDGYAYFFACAPEGFLNKGCRAGRVLLAHADDRAAFAFWDGGRWQPELSRAARIVDEVGSGLSVTVNPWLGCYLMVSGVILRSAAALRVSERLESGWGSSSAVRIEQAPDGPILAANAGEYDYLFHEHPALRSDDGRTIVLSYARPLGNFQGEVRLVRVTLR